MKSTVDILGKALEDLAGRGLLIGGLALQQYAVVRHTLDVDCLICDADRDRLVEAFGKEGFAVTAETESFVRLHHGSVHMMNLDLLLVDAETLSKMLRESLPVSIGSRELRVPCLAHLVALKLHAVRNDPKRELRDLSDVVDLLRANPDVVSDEELERLAAEYGPDGALDKIRTQL
ncbi:MAG: nucleotidyltransferase family protein [Planctomycetota bacterium]